ncbi:DUF4913 domain-containing protein [Pseudonocardia nigra]|uniref:DUF4913 domain-containing protein n=1 Tax=Pseudonocardia nigra TaxID=1921578 RepID=UPI001C60571B|nr:DUF4913 domain-containing protein [Pseudonocardia nigra]
MTEDSHRATTELQARVAALEAWRAHQSDLLDELINGRSEPADAPLNQEPTEPTEPPEITELDGDALIEWVHTTVTPVIARPLRGEIKWCPQWWEHPEAVFRFAALQRAWTELAGEPGAALSIWIRDHLDPCLRELLNPLGPFADCGHNERYRAINAHTPLATLPTTDPADIQ